MVEDVLLGLLFCKTNDAMSIFLLPVIVHVKEKGKRKKGYGGWWLAVGRVAKEDLLYEEAFYGLRWRNEK